MAVNLIDSNDIKVIQSDNDIELQTDKTTLNTIINAKIKNSNTSSTTDTYSCDYINSYIAEWTSLGTQTGTTAIALPNDFNELMVEVNTANAGNFQFYFIRDMLSSTNKEYGNGSYISINNCCQVHVNVSLSSTSIAYVYVNGENNITSTSSIKAWYR